MLHAPRQFAAALSLLTLLVLLGASVLPGGGAKAQAPTAAAAAMPTAECPAPNSEAFAATESSGSLYYDYAILLDVSLSMEGWRGDPASYYEDLDIFDEVKASLKTYVSELQPGSMVYVIPFGNPVVEGRVRQFGIEQDAPDGGEADALAYIDSIQADNNETHITASIAYALDMLSSLRDDDRQHIQTVLLYTDGIGNGPEDLNANNQFDVGNIVASLREFRQEQPYLFVKYVSLGVDVPGAEILGRNGVEVVQTVQGVPPVREVRLAVVPDTLGALAPGVPASNRLCAASGDIGEGVSVSVNDDPSELPPDVQVAFRAESGTLEAAGIPLTYTLVETPGSGLGPFTTHVEVRSEDPEVFLVPGRLPVTFSAVDPIPEADLTFGAFPERTVTRGLDDAAVEWTLPVDLIAPDGGEVALRVDRSGLDELLPGAALGFRAADGSLSDEVALNSDMSQTALVLTASQEDLAALSDGQHPLDARVLATTVETDLSIEGPEVKENGDGTSTVFLPAPLVMQPPPTCTAEVGDMQSQTVTVGEASTEPVRWDALVELDGSNGCQGEVTFNDDALREMIPGAEATFLVNGEERAELDLSDTRSRADLVVTAPRNAVAALGPGDYAPNVELIVAPARSNTALPEGATENDDGTFTIPVPVRVTVGERIFVRCEFPSFAAQEVTRYGATAPPLRWSGPVACEMGGGATVTLRIAEPDPGVTARFVAEGAEPAPSVTLADGDPMPTLTLEVERGAAQSLGAGNRQVAVMIELIPEPASAALEVEGASRDESGGGNARVVAPIRVVEPSPLPTATLTVAPFAPQTVVRGMDSADVVWTAVVDFTGQAGSAAVLRVDRPRLEEEAPGASLGFRAEDGSLVEEMELNPDRLQAELVLSASQESLATLADGERQLPADVIVSPRETDLTIDGAEAEPNGDGTFTVSLPAPLVMLPQPTCTVDVGEPPGQAVTIGDASGETVRWETVVDLDGSGGCRGEIVLDDGGLREKIPGAEAMFLVNGEERVELYLDDNRFRADLVVTAPRDAVAGLGAGEHTAAVDLIVTPEQSIIELPEGATANDDGTFTISVPVRVTVSEQPVARCTLPSFDAQEVIRDRATEPALQYTNPLACELSGGATVTLQVAETDPGVTASFVSEGAEPARTVTLAAGDAMPSLSLEVDRVEAQRRGVGNHELAAVIHVRPTPASALLEVEGASPAANGDANARVEAPVRVVDPAPTPLIVMQPIELAPDPIAIETRGASPDPLEWRGELDFDPQHGAQGTVAVNEGELPEGVAAFFEVGGMRLPSPVALAGQQGEIALMVQGSLAAAQALGAGERQWKVEVVLDPQGAEVRWPGSAREGNIYASKVTATLSIEESDSVDLMPLAIEPQTISSVPPNGDPVSFTAPVSYDLSEGATVKLRVDDGALRDQYNDAAARLSVDGQPVAESVELTDNGHVVELHVTAPKAAFDGGGPYELPAEVFALSENAFISIGDEVFEPGTEAPLGAVATLTIDVPSVTIDLGTWSPDVVEVPSTGTGAEPRHWERAIVASEMEEGARPSITLDLDDTDLAEAATIRFYENEVGDEPPIAEATGGEPATVFLEPGQERIIAVVEAPEDRLRGLGLGDDHQLGGTLTIDPNGAMVEVPGNLEPTDEPAPQEFAVRTRVYEPFDPMKIGRPVGLALLALALLLAIVFLRPGLPADAAIELGSGRKAPIVPLPRGGASLGAIGADINIGARGPVGEITGRVGGRVTGAAKVVAGVPISRNGDPVEANKEGNEWSTNVDPGDTIGVIGTRVRATYIRDTEGDSRNDGDVGGLGRSG